MPLLAPEGTLFPEDYRSLTSIGVTAFFSICSILVSGANTIYLWHYQKRPINENRLHFISVVSSILWTIGMICCLCQYTLIALLVQLVGISVSTQNSLHYAFDVFRFFFCSLSPFLYSIVVVQRSVQLQVFFYTISFLLKTTYLILYRISVLKSVVSYSSMLERILLIFVVVVYLLFGFGGGFVYSLTFVNQNSSILCAFSIGIFLFCMIAMDSSIALIMYYRLKRVRDDAAATRGKRDAPEATNVQHQLKFNVGNMMIIMDTKAKSVNRLFCMLICFGCFGFTGIFLYVFNM